MTALREGDILWEPDEAFKYASNIAAFMRWMKQQHQLEFADYEALWEWSVADIETCWATLWEYFGLHSPTPYECVLTSHEMPGAEWFPGARMNYAEHLLRDAQRDDIAVQSLSEIRPLASLSWRELAAQTAQVATVLRAAGVEPGDRVVSFMPNIAETLVAFLAAASIGAVWSNCSPEFGQQSALDRFAQIEPVVLFTVDGYRYAGRDFDRRSAVRELIDALPSLRTVIAVPYLFPDEPFAPTPGALPWNTLLATPTPATFEFSDLPFSHPLWIVYSSGTTGLPKPFVHGHGGILLELLKFCTLHMNLMPDSVTFMFTTSGWITWNVLTGCLLTGGSVVLYDGNPTYPDADVLWRMAADTKTTFFGASPAFVSLMMEQKIVPKERYDLSAIAGIFCTGSPASPGHFAWFYDNVKPDVWITSASGGTDISSSFVGGCPLLPVRAGEIQTRFLGADVHAYDDDGNEIFDEVGEFVVTQPLPSMPLYFWNDVDHKRYRETYFDTYPGVWRHGDYFVWNSRGGCYVRGRSDATLNRYGVRMGTAEFYRALESVEELVDSLVVNLDLPNGQFFMPLFVTLRDGYVFDDALQARIRSVLKSYSPRHVPDEICLLEAIPYTRTGKKMEVPVRKILMGKTLADAVYLESMADPRAIEFFVAYARTRTIPLYAS